MLETEEIESEKSWLCTTKRLFGLEHRTVRWCTGQCPVRQAGLRRTATLGKLWRRTAIIHRTIRWCTGLSGETSAASATVGRAIRGRRVARANGRLGAPDSVRCTKPARSYNGRLRQIRKEIRTGHAIVNVRCVTRQKARVAFLVGLQRLLAALGL